MKAQKCVGSVRALVWLWLTIILISPLNASDQIIRAEYFFDNDPGVGNGIEISIEPGVSISSSFNISVEGLEAGFHYLYIRVQNDDNNWSLFEGRTFYIQESIDAILATSITNAEYFFDDDPGLGSGSSLEVNEQSLVEENWAISVEGLSEGFHQLCIRTKDDLGQWGLFEYRTFYIQPDQENSTATLVVAAEYFFDSDPGVGHGTAIELTSLSGSIEENLSIFIDDLSSGFHQLYVRAKDDLGNWSVFEKRTFYVQESNVGSVATAIVAAEYFIDTDPGYGAATAIPIDEPLSLVDMTFTLDPSSLSFDTHQLNVRVKDDKGMWSIVAKGEFVYENKQGQIITFNELDIYYYQDVFELNGSSSSELALEYSSSDESIAVISGNTVTAIGVGDVIITASQSGNDSYIEATPVSQDLTVSKAILTATADNLSKTYGDDNPDLTISYEGFRNQETESVLDEQLIATVEATNESPVGDYEISLSSITDNHYEVVSNPGALSIEKASLAVIADSQIKTYGTANPTLTFYYSGFVNGEDEEVLDELPTISVNATTFTNVGIVPIEVTVGMDDNYSLEAVDGELIIEKALLIVQPDNKTSTYGAALPELTRTISGFMNNEDESVIDQLPELIVPVQDAGTQEILAMNGQDNNYDFQYESGIIEIAQAQLHITADDKQRTYGDANPDFSLTYTGFVNNENESVLDEWPEATTTADEFSNVGDYQILVDNGSDDNYFFNYHSGTLTVTKASLTVTADDHIIKEGDEIPELTMSYLGFKNDDTEANITSPTATTAAQSNSGVGTYEIVLEGGNALNYELTLVNGTLTIEEALGLIESGELEIYPNPITQGFSVKSTERIDRVDIYSNDGKLVKSFKGMSETYHISDLPNQIYLVHLIKDTSASFIRIVKR